MSSGTSPATWLHLLRLAVQLLDRLPGALIVYCLIIWYYARTMNRLDQEHGVAEEE
jgi:uncharacterized membrane protein